MNPDRFLVYGELYQELRDSIARAMLSDDTDELTASLEVTQKSFSTVKKKQYLTSDNSGNFSIARVTIRALVGQKPIV